MQEKRVAMFSALLFWAEGKKVLLQALEAFIVAPALVGGEALAPFSPHIVLI